MTIQQLNQLKPLVVVKTLCNEASLSYSSIAAKLHRHGARGTRSELTVPEGDALDAALIRVLEEAGFTARRLDHDQTTHIQEQLTD